MKKEFNFADIPATMSRCRRSRIRGCFPATPEDELLHGVRSLSDQIRSFRAGGLPLGSRELGDGNYDEDDSIEVDPSVDPGLDRFEKSEAIAGMISSRMAKKHKEKLDKAHTE